MLKKYKWILIHMFESKCDDEVWINKFKNFFTNLEFTESFCLIYYTRGRRLQKQQSNNQNVEIFI